jgi:phosphoribosylamine-glycine ligase
VSVAVVLTSRGYPGPYQTGYPIEGLGSLEPGVLAFHAGTTAGAAGYLTAGGRVLTLVTLGDSIAEARDRVYRNVDRVSFQGMTCRRDLALRELGAPALP